MANPPRNLLPLKETILSKSNGSPSKILLLGGLLSTTTLDGRTKLANGLPHRPTLQDVVHLGVNDLPEGLKQCALYLTLFPKESEIPTRRLFRLWSAENLMAENERFLKIYDCSIHDKKKFNALHIAIHRDIYGGGEANAQVNVPEAGQEHSETNAQVEITPTEPHRRMSTSDNSMPCGIQQLCSYVSFNTMKLGTRAGEIAVLLKPLASKRDSSLLWILDLEGVYKPSFPEELGNILPNLKYLGLRRTLLERLPKSVGILSRLETLDMKYTNISDLPDSIWEAENLRHLYMTEVVLNVAIGHQLESKKSLNCNIQTIWGLVTHVNSPMLKVLHKLTGLRKLALTWRGPAASAATDNILNHFLNLKKLRSLRLRLEHPSGEMGDMSRLKSLSNLYLNGYMGIRSLLESHIPPNLKVLTLSRSRLKEDPMGVLGKLKCLITLQLFARSYDGLTLSVSKGTFPSLRALKLWKLEGLNKWTIQANAMTCLVDLEIKDCKQLRTIDGLEQIKTLEVITLVRVPDELEQSVRDMQPNGPIIAKNENKKEHSAEEDGK
ncbi:disease resistance protein RPM1 [Eucalyptus grandis]|uniref:disease resistance protein RPM1 n=1 Tax=Eucalyptus grandis TaxID=71139 RepID=UPI00192EDA5B|nr:disease resistance protein RPM1 [Eucalyptus grandis]